MNIFDPKFIQEMAQLAITWLSVNGINLLAAIAILFIGRYIAKRICNLIQKVMRRGSIDETLISFIGNITYYTMLVAVVLAAIGQVGVNVTSFLAVLGAASLAVGLALKDSLSNFAAGVMLILLGFFRKGDYVTVAGTSGTVQSIQIFNTVLTTPDNQKIIVPNASILNSTITNVTANPTRRLDLVMGIGYDDDLRKAKALLETIISEQEGILNEPQPVIAVNELGDSSVNFIVRPWVKTSEYWTIRWELIEKIKLAFDENGIGIPFPQMDVHLYNKDQ